jgi:cytochrome c556
VPILVAAALVVLAVIAPGCRDRSCPPVQPCPERPAPAPSDVPSTGALDAPSAPPNVVQLEMRMMTEILESTVRGIGARDVSAIAGPLQGLHAAKDATTGAVKSGAYQLPKNAANVDGFLAMDDAFHAHLGALVKASRANDVPAAATALGAIMQGCHACHEAFRP